MSLQLANDLKAGLGLQHVDLIVFVPHSKHVSRPVKAQAGDGPFTDSYLLKLGVKVRAPKFYIAVMACSRYLGSLWVEGDALAAAVVSLDPIFDPTGWMAVIDCNRDEKVFT